MPHDHAVVSDSAPADEGSNVKTRLLGSAARRLIGLAVIIGLTILASLTAPRLMQDNLNVCMSQYAADKHIAEPVLRNDVAYQPEFIQAISLCSVSNP